MDRAQKVKKVGVRYYETHNVKNKNKNRKTPASATEGQKAKRSKHWTGVVKYVINLYLNVSKTCIFIKA